MLARGSQRRMDPNGMLPEDLLRTCMDVALRGVDVPHYVVVHSVEGLRPGLYRWPNFDRPLRAGMMREELYRVCMDQGLAHDASFVVIAATEVAALDEHQYRQAQLAAGLVEGRLHLLAYALGASASGMTFVDGKMAALLGQPLDGLLFTCVGVPEYASGPGGEPGAPAEVRLVTPAHGRPVAARAPRLLESPAQPAGGLDARRPGPPLVSYSWRRTVSKRRRTVAGAGSGSSICSQPSDRRTSARRPAVPAWKCRNGFRCR